jgi:predicted phosphoribosyltransferase
MKITENRSLRDRIHVFRDRQEAGRLLADMLIHHRGSNAIILSIPSGGIPVAAEIAKMHALPIDLLIVRKIQIPANPEAGFGAVGPDGSVVFNKPLLDRLGLSDDVIVQQKSKALESIENRNRLFRKNRPYPSLENKKAIIVDDGLASGYTMLAAIQFVRKAEPHKIIVAVPTASERTALSIASEIDELHCLNIRSGLSFAVADAYSNWYDLSEEEVLSLLASPIFSL